MSPQMAQMGSAGFDPINQQWGGLSNYAGIVGGPTTLGSSSSDSNAWSESQTQSSNESWNDTFNASITKLCLGKHGYHDKQEVAGFDGDDLLIKVIYE